MYNASLFDDCIFCFFGMIYKRKHSKCMDFQLYGPMSSAWVFCSCKNCWKHNDRPLMVQSGYLNSEFRTSNGVAELKFYHFELKPLACCHCVSNCFYKKTSACTWNCFIHQQGHTFDMFLFENHTKETKYAIISHSEPQPIRLSISRLSAAHK